MSKTPFLAAQIPSRRAALFAAAASALSLHAGLAVAADAPAAAAKSKAVSLEAIAGGTTKRITLTAKAAERLDIQTGMVSEEVVVRRQLVSGMVVYPQRGAAKPEGSSTAFGQFTPVATNPIKPVSTTVSTTGPSIVVVNLSPGEYERLAKDKPARITPLYTREKSVGEMLAPLSSDPPIEDNKRTMLTLHYLLPNSDHALPSSTRMRVELQMQGSEDKQKVVPYNAVHYDAKGAPWVYVNTKPLTFERQRITVARVVGKLAVLSDGPAVGTPIVTVGASLLYGTEVFGK